MKRRWPKAQDAGSGVFLALRTGGPTSRQARRVVPHLRQTGNGEEALLLHSPGGKPASTNGRLGTSWIRVFQFTPWEHLPRTPIVRSTKACTVAWWATGI